MTYNPSSYAAAYRERRIQLGLCISCGKPFPPCGSRQCLACRKRWAERARQKSEAARQARIRLNGGTLPKRKGVKLGVDKTCETCGVSFYVKRCELKTRNNGRDRAGNMQVAGPRRYCSRECADKALMTNTALICIACQGSFYASKSQVHHRKRRTCSRRCKNVIVRQVAEKRRIELGYTKHQLDRLARYSPEAAVWRKAVFERDDYTCQDCGQRGGRLEADHLKPFAYFPELRFEISNGQTLCRPCHDKTKRAAIEMRRLWVGSKEICRRDLVEIGRAFGLWTTLSVAFKKRKNWYAQCVCRCGVKRDVHVGALVCGASRSCGRCLPRDRFGRIMSPYNGAKDQRGRTEAGENLVAVV